MARLEKARWWTIRRVSSRKAATYRCPLCGYQLHAMSEHVLIAPEGDAGRRRHAHAECVQAARMQGRLPSRSEWERTQPRPDSLWRRMRRRLGSTPRGNESRDGGRDRQRQTLRPQLRARERGA